MRRSTIVFFAFATLSLVACKKDKDGDGYKGKDDCDDSDVGIHPGMDEICDGIDNNCDGQVDEGLLLDWYADADTDTYGDPDVVVSACNQPDGYEDNADDCNDGSNLFHPGAIEDDCEDPNDYNCDGSVGYEDVDGDGNAACNDCDDNDPEVFAASTWYIDYDGDTYGSALYTTIACTEPLGYTDDFEDCDDVDPGINPETHWYPDVDGDGYGDIDGETQQCDAPVGPDLLPEGAPDGIPDYDYLLDNTDCDDTDADVNPDTLWFLDADGDSYGIAGTYVGTCEQPEGYAPNAEDCNDEDAEINPAALEVCDGGTDNDCDGLVDESDAVDAGTFYADSDADGYGDPDDTTTACDPPLGYAATGDDCDDALAEVNPGAVEVCNNGQDDDCDGTGDQCTLDLLSADGVYSGSSSSEYVGTSVAAMGDLNSDGYDDFAVGAKGETSGGANAGAAYVVFGGPEVGGEVPMTSAGKLFTGEAGDRAGRALGGGGDLNDDGYVDLIVASPAWDKSATQLDRGRLHVVFGPISPGTSESLSDGDVEFTGQGNYNYAGVGLAVGDFDGDEIDDLLVGASGNDMGGANNGTIYVVYGPIDAGSVDGSDVNDYITGEGNGDEVGGSIRNLGDLDGDGIDDILVGSPKNDTGVAGTSPEGGAVYIMFGPITSEVSLASADAAYRGESAGDKLGGTIGSAGDVNGDGTMDFVAGATLDDTAGPDSGALYLVHGNAFWSGGAIDEAAATGGAKFHGAETGDGFGSSAVADGDVDGDGTNDIVVSAPSAFAASGSVYVFYGAVEGTVSAAEADARFDGDATEDQVGNSLAFVGDVDGSGANDAFLIGAQNDDSTGTDDGAVYLMLGIGL